MTPGQQIDRPDFYAMYMVNFGIVSSSKYSSSNWPNLYVFLRMAGSYLKLPRSLNTIMLPDAVPKDLQVNACILAYATRRAPQ